MGNPDDQLIKLVFEQLSISLVNFDIWEAYRCSLLICKLSFILIDFLIVFYFPKELHNNVDLYMT